MAAGSGVFLFSSALKSSRKAQEELLYFKRRRSHVVCELFMDNKEAKHRVLAATVSCCCVKERRPKSPIEMRDTVCWQHGYANWTDKQFKKRLRVNRDNFHFILNNISDLIIREVTKFKEPVSPDRQPAITLYHLAHGCSHSTVGDLFGVASSTACRIFNEVICVIIQICYDDFVVLPSNEDEWKAELNGFLEDWGFPCIGAFDGFHVYTSRNFYNFKKPNSVTNMGFVGANKRFLWAGVGAPGSVHDSTLLQSSPIFTDIESGQVLPDNVLR